MIREGLMEVTINANRRGSDPEAWPTWLERRSTGWKKNVGDTIRRIIL